MKIGLSYSRCIRDVIDGVVDLEDVLVIITRTDFNPHDDEQWAGIWHGYHGISLMSNPEWASYPDETEETFRNVTIELYDSGRMHQPRQFGAFPRRLPHIWLETILPSEELDKNPGVKAAWNKFQMLAGLSDVQLDDEHKV
jgi:hypothetical protein